MSEELEWELFDIFASGIFAFPVYEHNSARRIVRYLLMRGVPAEDVATAIEDHAVDLQAWLERRPGHHMVGEWVMAWLNDSRDQYKADRRDRRLFCRLRRRVCQLEQTSPIFDQNGDNDQEAGNEFLYGCQFQDDFDVAQYDGISYATTSTTSSESGSDDDDVSNAAVKWRRETESPHRKWSRRSSSPNASIVMTSCCRCSYKQQQQPRQRQQSPPVEISSVGANSEASTSVCTVSGTVIVPTTNNLEVDDATLPVTESVGQSRKISASDSCLNRKQSEFLPSTTQAQLSCLDLTRFDVFLHKYSVQRSAKIERYDEGTMCTFDVGSGISVLDRFETAPTQAEARDSSISSRYKMNRPPALNIETETLTLPPTPQGGGRRCRTISATATSMPSDEPPDSGNVSDMPCTCVTSGYCGGGVGHERSCHVTAVDTERGPSGDGVEITPLPVSNVDDVIDDVNYCADDDDDEETQSGTKDDNRHSWCGDCCNGCLYMLPHYVTRRSVQSENVPVSRDFNSSIKGRHSNQSSPNLSTASSCRQQSLASAHPDEVSDTWPTPPSSVLADAFPIR